MKINNLVQIKDVPYIYVDFYLFEGTLEEVSSKILNIRNQLADAISNHNKQYEKIKGFKPLTPIESYKEIKLKISHNYDYNEIKLNCFREKTEDEIKEEKDRERKRKESAKKAAETRALAKEKRERTLLANLKKKYDGR